MVKKKTKIKSKPKEKSSFDDIDETYLVHLGRIEPDEGFKDPDKIEALKVENSLGSLRQEVFCQLYTSSREHFAHGTNSYVDAYNINTLKPNWYKSAQACSSRLLSNVMILKRIDELLELKGLNDQFVDKQLEFLIAQHSDYKTKLGGIKEYNELKQRITKKLELSGEIKGTLVEFIGGDKKRKK